MKLALLLPAGNATALPEQSDLVLPPLTASTGHAAA